MAYDPFSGPTEAQAVFDKAVAATDFDPSDFKNDSPVTRPSDISPSVLPPGNAPAAGVGFAARPILIPPTSKDVVAIAASRTQLFTSSADGIIEGVDIKSGRRFLRSQVEGMPLRFSLCVDGSDIARHIAIIADPAQTRMTSTAPVANLFIFDVIHPDVKPLNLSIGRSASSLLGYSDSGQILWCDEGFLASVNVGSGIVTSFTYQTTNFETQVDKVLVSNNGNRLILISPRRELSAIDLNRHAQWSAKIPAGEGWDSVSPPTAHDVVLEYSASTSFDINRPVQNRFFAISLQDGSILWSRNVSSQYRQSIYAVSPDSSLLAISSDKGMHIVAAKDGVASVAVDPAIVAGECVFSSDSAYLICIAGMDVKSSGPGSPQMFLARSSNIIAVVDVKTGKSVLKWDPQSP
jgi:hypothetical protein